MPDKVSDFFIEQWFAIFLFLISVYIAYWFWRNPIEIKELNKVFFEDGNTRYISAINHKGWIVRKVIHENAKKRLPWKFCATKRNNPGIKNAPDNIDELKKLNCEEC